MTNSLEDIRRKLANLESLKHDLGEETYQRTRRELEGYFLEEKTGNGTSLNQLRYFFTRQG